MVSLVLWKVNTKECYHECYNSCAKSFISLLIRYMYLNFILFMFCAGWTLMLVWKKKNYVFTSLLCYTFCFQEWMFCILLSMFSVPFLNGFFHAFLPWYGMFYSKFWKNWWQDNICCRMRGLCKSFILDCFLFDFYTKLLSFWSLVL